MSDADPTEEVFTPDWVSPPGNTIEDILFDMGKDLVWLARTTKLGRQELDWILAGYGAITHRVACRLHRVLGNSVAFWLAREAHYRMAIARAHGAEL